MARFPNLLQYEDNNSTEPIDNSSNLKTIKLSPDNIAGTTVQRDQNGRFKVAFPIDDSDAANKAYVDFIKSSLSSFSVEVWE